MKELSLTEHARKRIIREIRRSDSRLVPALLWMSIVTSPTYWFGGLFRTGKTSHKTGWFICFYESWQRPKEWILDVDGLKLSVSPEMRKRLATKTLDCVSGRLIEL
jgi:hypothetical protein